jgi:uncharacterized protein (TIGR02266 family)
VVDDEEVARRSAPRAGVVLQLQYRNAGHLLVSYCTNLSRGGVFVPSSDPLPPDSELTLQLAVPGESEPVELQAKVRWVREFDAAQGPAGMGVQFEGIDALLGDRIDSLVASFTPMKIELCGDRPQAWGHIAGLVRSLVTCETRERVIDPHKAASLAGADLVIVDLEHGDAAEPGLQLLAALAQLDPPPPAVALCPGRDAELRARAGKLARVVTSPLDPAELRVTVLDSVTLVRANQLADRDAD